MNDIVMNPEQTRTGAAKSVLTNAEKAAKFDALQNELAFRHRATPMLAQAQAEGELNGAKLLAQQIEANRQRVQANREAGLADLFRQEQGMR